MKTTPIQPWKTAPIQPWKTAPTQPWKTTPTHPWKQHQSNHENNTHPTMKTTPNQPWKQHPTNHENTHPTTARTKTSATRHFSFHMKTWKCSVCWLLAWCCSQQHASVSQGRICSNKCTCCTYVVHVADQTLYLTQSQYTDTWPTSPSVDPISPGAWQGSHWTIFKTGTTQPWKISRGASSHWTIFKTGTTRPWKISRGASSHWTIFKTGTTQPWKISRGASSHWTIFKTGTTQPWKISRGASSHWTIFKTGTTQPWKISHGASSHWTIFKTGTTQSWKISRGASGCQTPGLPLEADTLTTRPVRQCTLQTQEKMGVRPDKCYWQPSSGH